MTHSDKLECQEIAREINESVLAQHIASCPHGMRLTKWISLSVGIAVGSGLASGSLLLAALKAVGVI